MVPGGKGFGENALTRDNFSTFYKEEGPRLLGYLREVAVRFRLSEEDAEVIFRGAFGELFGKVIKPSGRVEGPRLALYQAVLKHLVDRTRGRDMPRGVSEAFQTLKTWGPSRRRSAKEGPLDAKARLLARATVTSSLETLHDLEVTLRAFPPGPFFEEALRGLRRTIREVASILSRL